jgi:hypothetical protein
VHGATLPRISGFGLWASGFGPSHARHAEIRCQLLRFPAFGRDPLPAIPAEDLTAALAL